MGVKIRILIFTPRRLYSVGDFARGGIKNTIRIIRSEKFLRDKPKRENRYMSRFINYTYPDNIVGGIFYFKRGTSDEEIINTVLNDFCLKLYNILKCYYKPSISCSSLCLYEIFNKWWGIEDRYGCDDDDEVEIYSKIPSEICGKRIEKLSNGEISQVEVEGAFSFCEFPIITIKKEKLRNKEQMDFGVFYTLAR